MQFKLFLQSMFSESDKASFSRAITLLIVAFVLGWDTSFVIHTHSLPPGTELMLQTGFMGVFYFANKGAGVLTGRKPGDAQPEGTKDVGTEQPK